MIGEDLEQVQEIEREAFPTLVPPTAYRRELKNRQAGYIVCLRNDQRATPVSHSTLGVIARLLLYFGLDLGERRSTPELIVGFVGAWFMAGEAHIVSIAVRESHRGQGIGELLLQSIIDTALLREQEMVTLEVRISNTPAQKLYEKYGFKQVGIRKRYYSDNQEDAYIMTTDELKSETYQKRYSDLRVSFSDKFGAVENC